MLGGGQIPSPIIEMAAWKKKQLNGSVKNFIDKKEGTSRKHRKE
jgi:hypothetical protein